MANRNIAWVLLSGVIGLVVGMNLAGIWPQIPLHAVATHGQDDFAICTSPMDADIEGIFVLDYLTGDLKATVLNVQMRRFNTLFEYNVMQDLPVPDGQMPKLRMVSGYASIRQHVAAGQLASSVIYVAEATSGQLAAYGIPWIAGRASGVVPVRSSLVLLDRWQYRTTNIRNR